MSDSPATTVAPAPTVREPLAYSIPQALELVPIGRSSLYELIGSGQLRTVKLNGRRLIPRDALEALVGGDS